MSNAKISQLTDAATLAGTEQIAVVQSSTTLKSTISAIATYFRGLANAFTKNQSVAFVELTDAATINTDASLSNNFHVTLGGNRTLANPTNLTDGMVLNWYVEQPVSSPAAAYTLAFGTKFKFFGGSNTLSTGSGARDLISGIYYASDDVILCNMVLDAA